MEVIHEISHPHYFSPLQFLKDGDRYAVRWYQEVLDPYWMPWDRMISWALIPVSLEPNNEMDQFILDYFGEGMCMLAALENA